MKLRVILNQRDQLFKRLAEDERKQLAKMLRRLAIEKRPFACVGCGLEHRCSLHGCAVLLRTAEILMDMNKD
jgi:hypothetical protein